MASHRLLLMFLGIALASCAATTTDRPPESGPVRREGSTSPAVPPRALPAARIVPVVAACRGKKLKLDSELEPCACGEREVRQGPDGARLERAGAWCGLRHPEETTAVTIDVEAERPVIAAGEATHVLVRIANPNDRAVIIRFPSRHLHARLARTGGEPLEGEAFSSGDYNDEALVELEGHGAVEIVVPVAGTYSRHTGSGDSASIEPARLAAGQYAVRVFLEGVGGVASRLVPIELR